MLAPMSPMVRRRRRRGLRRVAGRVLGAARERPAVLAGLAVLSAVVLVALWCGLTVWRAADGLQEVERSGRVLRQQLVEGDADGARRALADFQAASAAARARTDGPTFGLLERLPVVGDDAAAVAVAADVLDDLGREGLPPVVESAEQVTARAFHPQGHRFPLERIAALQDPARQSEAAFDEAAHRLAATDSSALVGPLRTRFDQLRSLVVSGRETLGSAYRAATIMPELLGRDGPRRYLLVLQNNAELRSTGGLAGSVSLLEARDGRVDIVHQEPSHNFGITDRSPVPLTREERQVFGDTLGQYFLNAVMTPDIPRAAELMAAHWRQDRGQPIDGVLLVDPVAVSYLLDGTGPVAVPGYTPVTAETVVTAVENTIYRLTTDFAAHDAYQNAVAKAVFDVLADGRGDAVDVVTALTRGVAEGRIRMHSFDPAVQEQVAGTAIAGEMPGDEAALGVYLNDATASKMSFYLDYDVSVVSRSCEGAAQELAGTVELTNDTPDDVADLPPTVTGYTGPGAGFRPGDQKVVAYLMVPASGDVVEVEVAGRRIDPPATFPLQGRTVAPVFVHLRPEESQAIEFVVRTGPTQTGDVEVFVTPGATAGSASRTVPSTCTSQ